MATPRVLARAVELGRNLVVTQEPVFYNANDEPGQSRHGCGLSGEEGLHRAARARRLALRRSLEQPPAGSASRRPGRALSWEGPGTNGVFTIPETTLSALTAHLRERLGDSRRSAHARCRGNAGANGAAESGHHRHADHDGRLKDADVVVAGEPREWEVCRMCSTRAKRAPNEGIDRDGPRRLRRAGHAGVRRMAPDVHARTAGRGDRPLAIPYLESTRMTAQEIVTRIRQKLAEPGHHLADRNRRHVQGRQSRNARCRASRRPGWRRSTC